MSTIDLKEIKFKELSAAVVALNNSECFKGKEKIATVGVSKIALVEAFLAAVENVPDNEKGEWTGPEAAGDYYNKIVIAENEVVDTVEKEEEPIEVVEEENAEAIETVEVVSEKKKKTSKMPSNKFNIYQAWKNNQSISIEKLEEIAPLIKKTTIKGWIQAWRKNKNLPALS